MSNKSDIMVQQQQVPSLTELQEQNDLEENLRAPQHVLCEKNNNGISRKPRSREVHSRYKSGISAPTPNSVRRFGVPSVSRNVMPSDVTTYIRPQSVEVTSSEIASDRRPQSVEGDVTNFKRPQSVERSRISSAFSGVSNGLSNDNGEFMDHITKCTPDMVHGPSNISLALDCKGTTERKRSSMKKQHIEQSENARPREKLQSHAKQDRNRLPCTSTLNLSGIRLSKSLDLMDRTISVSTALAQGKPVAASGRIFGRGVHGQAFSQTINEGSLAAFSASKQAFVDGAAGSLRGYGRERLQNFDSGKQVSAIEGASQVRLTSQETELACADRFHGSTDTVSDSESVSSGSTISSQDAIVCSNRRSSRGRASTRRGTGTAVPARFWKETMRRLRRASGIGSQPLPESDSSSTTFSLVRPSRNSKVLSSGTDTSGDGVLQSSESLNSVSRSQSSSGSHPPISSVKPISTSSTLRGPLSPIKPGGRLLPPQPANYQSIHSSNAGSVISLKGDVRKGKQGMNHLEASHMLRMLQNRLLQWRFVNAKAEAARNAQTATAEKLLYNAWAKISELRHSVSMKQVQLQRVKQADKLSSIISGQMNYLEDFNSLQHDHSNCLSGAIKALEAATVRLPITTGVKADVQSVKGALDSASDVMQSTGSAICSLLPKVDEIDSLISELAQVVTKERSLLDECSYLLETADALEVEESSLMTHLIQLKQEKCGSSTQSMENGAPV